MNPFNPMNQENPMNWSIMFAEQTDDFLDITSFDSNNSLNVAFSNESNYDCRKSYNFKLTFLFAAAQMDRAAKLEPPEK